MRKKNLKTHPFGFILSASEGQTKKRRDYQMCSETIDINGVWIAKLRATVNLAKKLKKVKHKYVHGILLQNNKEKTR